jgi:hypothetical protein
MKEPNMTYIDQAFAKMIEAGLEEVERTTEKVSVPDGIWAPNSRWEYGDDEGPEWPFSKFEEIVRLMLGLPSFGSRPVENLIHAGGSSQINLLTA